MRDGFREGDPESQPSGHGTEHGKGEHHQGRGLRQQARPQQVAGPGPDQQSRRCRKGSRQATQGKCCQLIGSAHAYLFVCTAGPTGSCAAGRYQHRQSVPNGQPAGRSHLGGTVKGIMIDNGVCYTSRVVRKACARLGIRHRRTRLYTPRTNGKVEHFI